MATTKWTRTSQVLKHSFSSVREFRMQTCSHGTGETTSDVHTDELARQDDLKWPGVIGLAAR